jgi:hypothetical protein
MMGKKRTMCSVGSDSVTFWSPNQAPVTVEINEYISTISAYKDEAHLKDNGRDGVITFLLEQDWKPFSVTGETMYFQKKLKTK